MLLTKHKPIFLCCVALVVSGGLGNLCDNIFYGKLFTPSTYYNISEITPFVADSAPWFYGKVVDMLYFPLFQFNWPEFLPFIGGKQDVFFSPTFNVADAAVSCGSIVLLIWYPKTLLSSLRIIKLLTMQKLHKLYKVYIRRIIKLS